MSKKNLILAIILLALIIGAWAWDRFGPKKFHDLNEEQATVEIQNK